MYLSDSSADRRPPSLLITTVHPWVVLLTLLLPTRHSLPPDNGKGLGEVAASSSRKPTTTVWRFNSGEVKALRRNCSVCECHLHSQCVLWALSSIRDRIVERHIIMLYVLIVLRWSSVLRCLDEIMRRPFTLSVTTSRLGVKNRQFQNKPFLNGNNVLELTAMINLWTS